MSSWGCPHEDNGTCLKVANRSCDPGMKGCVLAGRFTFSNPAKNLAPRPAAANPPQPRRRRSSPSK
jgi:hypothetical protein